VALITRLRVRRHCVPTGEDGLSPMQREMLSSRSLINVGSAPTGAGKSFVFRKAVADGERVLFLVPTKRLGQNQRNSMIGDMCDPIWAAAEGREPWSAAKAAGKIQCWNSDFSDELRERGVASVTRHYANRLASLHASDGGEIVFATPELISYLIMNPTLDGTRSDVGPGFIVSQFDRIVYDEFHVIEERGLGLMTTLAFAARSWGAEDRAERRASLYFLSATPVDLRPVLSTLGFDINDPDEVRMIGETITGEGGRALHGDVEIEFHEGATIKSHLSRNRNLLEVCQGGTKGIFIYDSVRDLREQQDALIEILRDERPEASILIDSGQHAQIETEISGRSKRIEDKDFVIGTSTIEMGVTIPNTRLMVTNPGIGPSSLLQRIGRVARGDMTGRIHVVSLNFDATPWLRDLCGALGQLGEETDVGSFTNAFAQVSRIGERFSADVAAEAGAGDITAFRTMGMRAVNASALYHNIIERRLRDARLGGYAARMAAGRPPQAGPIAHLLGTVGRGFASGRKWVAAFEREAERLRSFAPTIRIYVDGFEKPIEYSTRWIQRNTRIMEECPVEFDQDGYPAVRCSMSQWRDLRSRRELGQESMRSVCLPDGSLSSVGRNAVTEYLEVLGRMRGNSATRTALQAAGQLVSMTGIVPYVDADPAGAAATMAFMS